MSCPKAAQCVAAKPYVLRLNETQLVCINLFAADDWCRTSSARYAGACPFMEHAAQRCSGILPRALPRQSRAQHIKSSGVLLLMFALPNAGPAWGDNFC